eukprot:7469433-Pyramimonas_sp.AAC.1
MQQGQAGGRGLHRRIRDNWAFAGVVRTGGETASDSCQRMAAKAKIWAGKWAGYSSSCPMVRAPGRKAQAKAKENPRPPLGADRLRGVISALPEKAPCVDGLSKEDCQWLPLLALQRLADVYALVERE